MLRDLNIAAVKLIREVDAGRVTGFLIGGRVSSLVWWSVVLSSRDVVRIVNIIPFRLDLGGKANKHFCSKKAIVSGFMSWLVEGVFNMTLMCFCKRIGQLPYEPSFTVIHLPTKGKSCADSSSFNSSREDFARPGLTSL